MYSRDHAILSGLVAIPFAMAPVSPNAILVWSYMLILGVGIDLDHFLIARLRRGDWTNLRRCFQQPQRIVFAQSEIFDDDDIRRVERLLSHHLLGGVLVAFTFFVDRYLAIVTAVTIYTHVLADIYWDLKTSGPSDV
jgi:hypothetical protein